MQLAVPSALLWSLLAIPIVVFYILKIRLRRVPVSTVMFWNQIFDEKKPRSIWQQLRHLISLLLQLLFLALLVSALTDPFFSWQKLKAKRVVLVIDNSASMNATDAKPTRLDAAKDYAYELIRGLRLQDQMAIVSAGSVPRVEMGLTSHQKTLREAVDDVPQTDGPTRVSEAVELGRRLLADHENGEVIVLSDGRFDKSEELANADDVKLITYGEETGNVGITQFQVRRSLIDTIGYQILVEVQNASDEPSECRLEISLPDELVDVIPLTLEAGETWSQVVEHTSANGGHLTATLDVEDALSCDNQAVALLPIRRNQPVVLVSQGSLFLQSALASIPLVNLTVLTEAPASVPEGTIVVFHKKSPEKIPGGNSMFIQPTNSTDLWSVGDEISDPIVTKQDKDSALMTHVELENVLMPSARAIEFSTSTNVLAESIGGQPLYTSVKHENGKSLVLSVELEKGDLPLRTAFPIMITNAIAWFQGQQGELQQAMASGNVVACDLSENMNDNSLILQPQSQPDGDESTIELLAPVLKSPLGKLANLPTGTAKLTVGPLDHCGVWQVIDQAPEDFGDETETQVSPAETVLHEFACNLANASESDIRVSKKEEEIVQASIFGGRPLWFYLVVLGIVLTASEWFLYQRRWIS